MRLVLLRPAVLCAAALVAAAAPASTQPCPPLHVRNPDGNYIVPGVRGDIAYAGNLALDAFVHRDGKERPSVVVIHGGEWRSGSRIAHVGQFLELLTAAGYNWFSLDYRLAGLEGYEDSLADVRAALAFIRCRAGALGVDPGRLVLLGEDSGAHLAALIAAERPEGVRGAALLGGYYDLAAIPALKDHDAALLRRASPSMRVAERTVPLLVVHGGADREAPPAQARQYCAAVTAAGGRCRYLEAEGASHRLENWRPSQWAYKDELVHWLAEVAPAPRAVPAPSSEVLLKGIVYDAATGLKLDAFLPRSKVPTPAVVIVHGGGWEAGDKVTYVTPVFEPLARAGLAWFSIDYRLTPAVTHDEQLEDVRRALRFVRAGSARFNVDPNRIFLLGESASGQMAAHIAAEDPALAGVISFYGVYDFPAMVVDASPRSLLARLFRRTVLDDEARAVLRRYSPLYSAHAEMPPMLLVNGTDERLWAQAQEYAGRLKALGVRHEVVALDGAPHGMENWEGHPRWLGYKERLVAWIQRSARR